MIEISTAFDAGFTKSTHTYIYAETDNLFGFMGRERKSEANFY